MQSVDLSELDRLTENMNKLLEEAPEKRRELHERLAEEAKQEVDTQISADVGGDSGKVQSWQEPHVGSGGGYAAVRASDITSGNNSPGAITNYLENGHTIRKPSGQAKRYRPEIHTAYVDGKHFYESTRASMQSKAISIAEDFANQLAGRLEHG